MTYNNKNEYANDEFRSHEYITNMTLRDYDDFFKFKYENNDVNIKLYLLKHINENKVKNLYVIDSRFLIFCSDIRDYFHLIKISFYVVDKVVSENIVLLNYVDNIFCSKVEYIEYLSKSSDLINKQNVDLIRVITFGTYDLFHIGHVNILKRAKAYGSELVVGVSTDVLNERKGKMSINKLEKRKLDVKESSYADIIFNEESLEQKNEYVKKYNCNLLIMGDDWKDGFNFCDCACVYLPRTPDISTTLLKQHLSQQLSQNLSA